MNVWDQNPATGGAYLFGSGWGLSDLKTVVVNATGTGTVITNNILELYPNYNTYANGAGDPFWRDNGGVGPGGNKWLEANTYIQTTVTGETAVFSGTVSSFSLSPAFKAEAVIKIFDPSWNYIGAQALPLTGLGAFSVTMDTLFYPGYNIQKGFMVSGTNANPETAAANGFLQVITEPTGGSVILLNVGSGTTRTQAQAGYASIPAAISVTKTGAGTVVFDAVNAYDGPTIIDAGTLRVSNTGGLAASPVKVNAGGALAIAAAGTTALATVAVEINGAMTLRNDVRQTVNLNSLSVNSVVQQTVDSGTMTNGYMNWFNLPSAGGAYVGGSPWAIADLRAEYTSGTSVTLSPCYVTDTSSYWYTPSGEPGATGNKTMEALLYGQADGTLAGKTVKFSGSVPEYSLLSGSGNWTVKAFIRDFAADYSGYSESTVPITGTGAFSVSMTTNNDPTRHVQWGLATTGPPVWITDLPSKGNVVVQAVAPSAREGGKIDIGKGRINIAPGGT
ncbi:MAG: autotransporter-associated beta strand repeat-containing protein, partial [Solirubrobacterales bacterium]